jgi:hypothetical protein
LGPGSEFGLEPFFCRWRAIAASFVTISFIYNASALECEAPRPRTCESGPNRVVAYEDRAWYASAAAVEVDLPRRDPAIAGCKLYSREYEGDAEVVEICRHDRLHRFYAVFGEKMAGQSAFTRHFAWCDR